MTIDITQVFTYLQKTNHIIFLFEIFMQHQQETLQEETFLINWCKVSIKLVHILENRPKNQEKRKEKTTPELKTQSKGDETFPKKLFC